VFDKNQKKDANNKLAVFKNILAATQKNKINNSVNISIDNKNDQSGMNDEPGNLLINSSTLNNPKTPGKIMLKDNDEK
jgi:hypothetical protein